VVFARGRRDLPEVHAAVDYERCQCLAYLRPLDQLRYRRDVPGRDHVRPYVQVVQGGVGTRPGNQADAVNAEALVHVAGRVQEHLHEVVVRGAVPAELVPDAFALALVVAQGAGGGVVQVSGTGVRHLRAGVRGDALLRVPAGGRLIPREFLVYWCSLPDFLYQALGLPFECFFEEGVNGGAYDRRPGIVHAVSASGPERHPRHLANKLPVAKVPQFTRPKMPLHIAREPVCVPDYDLSKLLAVALRPCGVPVHGKDGRGYLVLLGPGVKGDRVSHGYPQGGRSTRSGGSRTCRPG